MPRSNSRKKRGRHGRLRAHFERLEQRLLLVGELEPNDSTAFANALAAGSLVEGTVGQLADNDYFSISLEQGAKLRLDDINYSKPYVLLGLPPAMELLDETGTVLAASAVGDPLEVTATQAGVYYLRITSRSEFGDIADRYAFQTSIVNFAGVSELEPNDARSSANALPDNQAFRGQLSAADPADFYSLSLQAGESLFVNFNGSPDQRPGVRLMDSSGLVVDSGLAGQGLSFNATKTDTYHLEVLDNSSAGQTRYYVGVLQVSSAANTPADATNRFENSSPWRLERGDSIVLGELSELTDVDTFAVTITSLARAEITLLVAGSESIPTYGRSLVAYDQQGALVAKSKDGVLNIERYIGSTPGEYFVQILATSSAGLGKYGLRAWNSDDFSNQRDVPLHSVDFTRQSTSYIGFSFTAPFAATEAIPFVTGLLQSRFGPYDMDVTLIDPGIPVDRYLRSGIGAFEGLRGGVGGGYYGFRRPWGHSANNATAAPWTLVDGSGPLIHETGHAAGIDHARDISSVMAYYGSNSIFPPGARFGFVDVDQRRPNQRVTNERNRLDWNLASGSQVPERDSDRGSPQEIDSFFAEMTLESDDLPLSLPTQTTPSQVVAGDLNGDGWKDLVVTHRGATFSVYMSDTRGGFLEAKNYNVDPMAWWNEPAAVSDYNRDGRDDVAVISRERETLTVLLAAADGTLVAQPSQSIGRWPQVLKSTDMNGDGMVDLVAANASNQVTIRLGNGDGTFQTPRGFTSGADPNHLVLVDFNGDGRVDVATANHGADTISLFLADAAGGYSKQGDLVAGAVARGLTSGDYDGDGDMDIASANHLLRKLTVWLNRGGGQFDGGGTYDLGVYAENLTTADFNGDGWLDIVASGNSRSLDVLLGAGDGTFSRAISFPALSGSVDSVVLDVDQDGYPDIATVSFWEHQLQIRTGRANSPRNDRVVVYGDLTSAQDVDAYSLTVATGEAFSFDIDAAEFQYPLDAELTILSSTGAVIASNRQAVDRESGIDSVDPYLATTFTANDTIRIVVTSERGTAGAYRLKVTPAVALKAEGPRVLAVVPDNGSVVDSTRQISFLFDKPIDVATVGPDSLVVRGARTGVQNGTAFLDPLDGFLVWTADATLAPDRYTVSLVGGASGLRDLFGHPLDGEVPGDFAFPQVSGDGVPGGDFVTRFTIDRADTTPATLYYAAYQRDPSNRGRFEVRWDDELSFKSVEDAAFTLRGAGPDGQFNTPDDRIQSLDAVYDKLPSLSYGRGNIDLYTRGYPDSDLYRLESVVMDVAGNPLSISEFVAVGSTVPESALFVDAALTKNGLTGSYVNGSLRGSAAVADWRATQQIAGTRVDSDIAFNTDSFGRRADVQITGGTDDNWDEFSVQWDGWITIPKNALRLQTRSDDGSRLWLDLNKNGSFEPTEVFDNHWGQGQAVTGGALTEGLPAGTYPIRLQFEEGVGGNRMNLEWIDVDSATIENGHVNGPSVIGMSIQPGGATMGADITQLKVDFSGSLDTSTLTSGNFRLRYSGDADFYDGDDTFVPDADGIIQWDPTLHRAVFEAATPLTAGFYLVELNGTAGGIRNSLGKLLDGEFLNNAIAGNTNLPSLSRHVSGDGLPGGDYRAGFSLGESIFISPSTSTLGENGGRAVVTVSRNSSTASALVVGLSSSDSTAATVPPSVTIPIGASAVSFTVSAVDDMVADGDQESTITASTNGYPAVFSTFVVVDDEVAVLRLTLARSAISELGGATTATVVRNTPTDAPLNVRLSSSDALRLAVPATVAIPAGASSATFTITAVDDMRAGGDQAVQVSAVADRFVPGVAQVILVDEETAALTLSILNGAIPEDGGVATISVTRNTPSVSALVVALASSDASVLSVPASVTIPAGQSSVTTQIHAVDDFALDGDQTVTITASASGFRDGADTVDVIDNERPALTVTIGAVSVAESAGAAATTVSIASNRNATSELVITLASSDTTEAVVPRTVTIPPGQSSITVDLQAVDDSLLDGAQVVTITASASGYATGFAQLRVTDVNKTPSADSQAIRTTEDVAVTIALTGDDGDDGGEQRLTYVVTSLPTHGTLALVAGGGPIVEGHLPKVLLEGKLVYVPAADDTRSATFGFLVRDDAGTADGGSDTSENAYVTVEIAPVNDAPTADRLADVVLDEDASTQTLRLTGITAGGGETQTLAVTATSSATGLIPHPTVDFSSSNMDATLRFAPTPDQHGTAVISVVIRDAGLDGVPGNHDDASVEVTSTVTVTSKNDPPTLSPLANRTLEEATSVDLTLRGTDVDVVSEVADVVGYSFAAGSLAGMILDNTTGRFHWTPTESQDGEHVVVFRAIDNHGLASEGQTVTFSVLEVNEPPVLENPGDHDVVESQRLEFKLSATDGDVTGGTSDPISFSIDTGWQIGMSVDSATGEFSWTPNASQAGLYFVVFRAMDSAGFRHDQSISISVAESNQAPTAITVTNLRVAENLLGATIGRVVVTDPDANDSHSFRVSDDRVEIVGDELKLKAGVALDFESSDSLQLDITVTDSGVPPQTVTHSLYITLIPNRRAWQYAAQPPDTNADGKIVPLDALRIINQLNEPTILGAGGRLPVAREANSALPFYDVNGDGFCTTNDVLRVVNYLNSLQGAGEANESIMVLTTLSASDMAQDRNRPPSLAKIRTKRGPDRERAAALESRKLAMVMKADPPRPLRRSESARGLVAEIDAILEQITDDVTRARRRAGELHLVPDEVRVHSSSRRIAAT